jgi:hypothetical protein
LRHLFADAGHFGRRFGESLFTFLVLGNVEKKTRFFEIAAMLCPCVDDALEGRLLFENPLGLLRVVPKIRLAGELG